MNNNAIVDKQSEVKSNDIWNEDIDAWYESFRSKDKQKYMKKQRVPELKKELKTLQQQNEKAKIKINELKKRIIEMRIQRAPVQEIYEAGKEITKLQGEILERQDEILLCSRAIDTIDLVTHAFPVVR